MSLLLLLILIILLIYTNNATLAIIVIIIYLFFSVQGFEQFNCVRANDDSWLGYRQYHPGPKAVDRQDRLRALMWDKRFPNMIRQKYSYDDSSLEPTCSLPGVHKFADLKELPLGNAGYKDRIIFGYDDDTVLNQTT